MCKEAFTNFMIDDAWKGFQFDRGRFLILSEDSDESRAVAMPDSELSLDQFSEDQSFDDIG